MLKVFKTCCQNCLLSKDRIVSPDRAKQIINDIVAEQSHFICHKASMEGKDIMCRKFYDELGHTSQMVCICGRIGAIEFIEQADREKLPTWDEMKRK